MTTPTPPGLGRRPIESFANVHAHNRLPDTDTVLSIRPGELMSPDGWYSVGLHPWDGGPASPEQLKELEELAANDKRIVAIGECGLDKLRGAPIDIQEADFEAQIAIAERLGLPLIIHCVRAQDRLLRLRRRHQTGRWILHGFRGGPAAARQLLDIGIDLSFGPIRNEAAYLSTPPPHRFNETD